MVNYPNRVKNIRARCRALLRSAPLLLLFVPVSRASWELQLNPAAPKALQSIFFIDTLHGWAVGDSATILGSTDGGRRWLTLQTGGQALYLSVTGTSPANLWVAGTDRRSGGIVGAPHDQGILLHSTDSGTTWHERLRDTTSWLTSIFFVDSAFGWAVGYKGLAYRTTDGGLSWNGQTTGTDSDLVNVRFVNRKVGWVVGPAGMMLHTKDGGASWLRHPGPEQNALYSIAAIDSMHAWISGSGGLLLRTTDGGSTWRSLNTMTSKWLLSVAFSDSMHGWAVGEGGATIRTADGGLTWSAQQGGTASWLYAVCFVDTLHGWAVGGDGVIVATSNGGVTSVPVSRSIPSEITLAQNYPNPFNPSTTIGYSLPRRSHVRLAVYNTLGQQVAELVNGEIGAGNHVVQFGAGNLASGIYVYRLSATPTGSRDLVPIGARNGQAGNFVQTRTFCVLR